MSLILANKNEIVAGKPVPWSLYDQEYLLLLSEGDLVRDEKHREELLSIGSYRELSWESSNDNQYNNLKIQNDAK